MAGTRVVAGEKMRSDRIPGTILDIEQTGVIHITRILIYCLRDLRKGVKVPRTVLSSLESGTSHLLRWKRLGRFRVGLEEPVKVQFWTY